MPSKDIKLKCSCIVKESGEFVVGERCKHCLECNTISEIHPFGYKGLGDLGFHNHH